ncbi:MAG TPA: hypothetical protein O0X27_03485 [Methanocorpusculum sp.]|nr:hypothetical protein [Methanocorpusculum sp.]
MKRILQISAIVLFVGLLVCAGIGDARYNDGATNAVARGINYSTTEDFTDVVFIGEENLNFTQFKLAGYTQLRKNGADPDETSEKTIEITSKNCLVTINSKLEEGLYYPVNSTTHELVRSGSALRVVKPSSVFGTIGFATTSTEVLTLMKADKTEVPALSPVLYGVMGTSSQEDEIYEAVAQILRLGNESGWTVFDFTLSISDPDNWEDTVLRKVLNVSGRTFDLSKNNPLYQKITPSSPGFFTYSEAINRGNHQFPLDVDIRFAIEDEPSSKRGLNGLEFAVTATQTISDDLSYTISPNPIIITEGGFADITLTGLPYQTYQLSIIPDDGEVYLGSLGDPVSLPYIVNPTKSTYSVADNSNMRLHANEGVDDNNQYSFIVNVVDPTNPVRQIFSQSFPIVVEENSHKPTLTVSDDVLDGKFSVGDIIRVTWGYEGTPYVDEITGEVESGYFYLEGMNFPKQVIYNVTLTDPVRLIYLDTSGLDAGTYTLSLVGEEHTAELAIYLSTPLLTASISGGSQGTVVQGSKLRLDWNARGSPYANYTSTPGSRMITSLSPNLYEGGIQWYIFGPNFAAAYDSSFSLVNGALGRDVPNGEGRYTYYRSFTENLSPGTYYMIVQHMGADKFYSLEPEKDSSGNIRFPLANVNVYTDASHNKTATLNVADKQAANAAEMIRSNLENGVNSDDLYVQLQFQIEAPWFVITDLSGGMLGDTLSLSGETNYPGGETVSLTITPISFTPQKAEDSQMQMTAYYEAPIVDTQTYNRRTFKIDGISTENWYPGTYSGTFKMKDTNYDTDVIKTMSFVVGPNGVITTPDITIVDRTEEAAPTATVTAQPTATKSSATSSATAQATTSPTSTEKSPAPLAGVVLGLAAAVALGAARIRR